MKVKCDFCDNYIDETDERCPYCGAPNEHMTRSGHGVPKTIEELLAFAHAHKLPLEKMRFFIGQDYKEPRAFGIYKNPTDGNFIVYKNKADGSRVIRYSGDDEAYAVNEIYQKMRSEILDRKQSGKSQQRQGSSNKANIIKNIVLALIIIVIVFVVTIAAAIMSTGTHSKGYYRYNNNYYYYDRGWYQTTGSDWTSASDVPDQLEDNADEYFEGKNTSDLSDSNIPRYESNTSDDDWNNDDWDDDDWDIDFGGWDSNDTNWDSNW